MAESKIPNSWDQEDWEKQADKPATTLPLYTSHRPNPAAAPFNPPTAPRLLRPSAPEFESSQLLYTPSAGGVPKTLYKPELKILRRSFTETSGGGGAAPSPPPSSEESEKERREREHKEKERRYKEARDRIMGGHHSPPDPPKSKKSKKTPEIFKTRTPPSSRNSPPRSTSVTSLSLNGGEFTAPALPVRYHGELDGKLLESQLMSVRGQEAPLTAETDVAGLDWDSFSRDGGWVRSGGYGGYVPPRQQNPGIYGGAAAADFPTTTTSRYNVYAQERIPYVEKVQKQPGGAQAGVVQAVRVPRGPDADGGRGFKGRGKDVVERLNGMKVSDEVAGSRV